MDAWGTTQKNDEEESRSDIIKLNLYELNTCVGPKQRRLLAIQATLSELNHLDSKRHDLELELDADKILYQKLTFSFMVDRANIELGLIASALEMVYRGNRARLALSFGEVGESMLPLFVQIIRNNSHNTNNTPNSNNHTFKGQGGGGHYDANNNNYATDEYNHKHDDEPSTVPPTLTKGVNDSAHGAVQSDLPDIHEDDDSHRSNYSDIGDIRVQDDEQDESYDGDDDWEGEKGRKEDNMDDGKGIDESDHDDESDHNNDIKKDNKLKDIDLNPQLEEIEANFSKLSLKSSQEENDETNIQQPKQSRNNQEECQPTITITSKTNDAQIPSLPQSQIGKKVHFQGEEKHNIFQQQETNLQQEHMLHHQWDQHVNKKYQSSNHYESMITHDMCPSNILAIHKVLRILRYYSRILSAMVSMANHPGLLDALLFQLRWLWMNDNHLSLKHKQRDQLFLDSLSIDIHISTLDHQINQQPVDNINYDNANNTNQIHNNNNNNNNSYNNSYNDNNNNDNDYNHNYNHKNTNSNDFYKPYSRHFPSSKQTSPNNPNESSLARIDAIATIVNLACAEENKEKMLYHPGLLDAIIWIADNDPSDEAREHAAIILMNLAYNTRNKLHMGKQEKLLYALVCLVYDKSPYTRRYACATLFSLAGLEQNTVLMARYDNGKIISALAHVLSDDPAEEARINAAEAIFHMVRNNTDDTVELMAGHPDALPVLAHSVLTDYSADVRAYSARALEWFAAEIHHPSIHHRRLLEALVMASAWTKTSCIVEALKGQSSIPQNRKTMVQHGGLLDALSNLASLEGINNQEVHTCAIATIQQLTIEESTRLIMARHSGVMTILTKETFSMYNKSHDITSTFADYAESVSQDHTVLDDPQLLTKLALKNLAEVL
mmetsp:Transcript_600/g.979  ORF Transcript_600/g.979 Transcript_600/m.979 type:complete len:892 (-) Transcript_600:103-2778(-)|eukprot:CAMPEP_0184859556 /NCGR_PEP_ID=MMETSP0580-20130426/4543_1 /TAXON_ID=1118495 /ORGANISM="Dactyliosolen fragilissimus" /LENGTH=891 /DNA_ID=CAMNT_0027356251 /DNA_START=31 /DNA_END=2706 /DNA_ORIENTATION=-